MSSIRGNTLVFLHRRLSEYLEDMASLVDNCLSPVDLATAIVLEEDLNCLMEECTELLISARPGDCAVESFELRGLTVIEEVECFFSKIAESHPPVAVYELHIPVHFAA